MQRMRMAALLLILATSQSLRAKELTGVLDWVDRQVLATPMSGVVAAIKVSEGDRVKRGQMLLRLDQTRIQARLAAAKADMAGVTESMQEAQREFERVQDLYDRTLISDRDLQLGKIAFQNAKANLAKKEAALVSAQWLKKYSAIVSSRPLQILKVHVLPGSVVKQEDAVTPMLTVANAGQMRVTVATTLSAVAGIKTGQDYAVFVGTKRYQGRVQGVSFDPVQGQGAGALYALSLVFDTDAALRAGQAARVVLPD